MPRLVVLTCLALLSTPVGVVEAQDSVPLSPELLTDTTVAAGAVVGGTAVPGPPATAAGASLPHVLSRPASAARVARALVRDAPAPEAPGKAPPSALPPVDDPRPSSVPKARGRHLEISVAERRIWLRDGQAVLFSAPVAVGKPVILEWEEQVWDFSTPRGTRTVIGKEVNPTWTPPEWHYVELAAINGWKLVRLHRGKAVRLADGTRVAVRGDRVGRVGLDGSFDAVPAGEEVVYGDTLFIPPPGTVNRHIRGQLGRYKLDLGDGYYIHGTPDEDSVGGATTHGCLRMLGVDLERLYRQVAVGTPVFIL